MRVIGGKFRGKSIKFLKIPSTRPLKDSVKENIFNILNHSNEINVEILNSNVLDLYSGIGSFGLECISRGAKNITFIEKDIEAANVLKTNLASLSISMNAKLINKKIEDSFKLLEEEKFDIFFFDPPFKDTKFTENLKIILQNKIFNKNHIVIIHREKETNDNINKFLDIKITKYYGRSKIVFGTFI